MALFNADLLSCGLQENDRAAAADAVEKLQLQGANNTVDGSVNDRLRTKFRRRRAELMGAIVESSNYLPISPKRSESPRATANKSKEG
jgi:hypothetical protein